MGYPQLLGIVDAYVTSVLGVSQDREAHVGAVDSQLVGPACDGAKREFT